MKRNKILFNIVAGLLFTGLITIISSCGKEESDPRDEFIGSYDISYSCVGVGVYNNGDDEGDYDFTFIVTKRQGSEDQLEFDNLESVNVVQLSGNDFVDTYCCYAGYFENNRIVFTQFEPGSAGFRRDCGEPTAYKR